METPGEREASEYLKNHKIVELMNNLTSMLLFYRPGKTFLTVFFPPECC